MKQQSLLKPTPDQKKVATLTKKVAALEKKVLTRDKEILRLQKLLDSQGITYQPPVKRWIKKYPELFGEYQSLMKEWNWRTFNLKTVATSVLRILDGDENGVVSATEAELLEYIRSIKKYGIKRWGNNPELRFWSPQQDSNNLFKSYGSIKRILSIANPPAESWKIPTSSGTNMLNSKFMTRTCTEEDLKLGWKEQKEHPNNNFPFADFMGDDRSREYKRRTKFQIEFDAQAPASPDRPKNPHHHIDPVKEKEEIIQATGIIEDVDEDWDIDESELQDAS